MKNIGQPRKRLAETLTVWRTHLIDRIDHIRLVLRVASMITALMLGPALVYYFGFELSPGEFSFVLVLIHSGFVLFLIRYLIKHIVYRFSTVLRRYQVDTFTVLFLALSFGFSLLGVVDLLPFAGAYGRQSFEWYQLLVLLGVLTFIYSSELGKAFTAINDFGIRPAQMMSLVFVGLIVGGALVLQMPMMHHGELSFVDALFTSASASCVTGLSVIDVGTQLSFRGQVVLMLLMQMGGLNIITFAMFFAFFYTQSFGLGVNTALKDIFGIKQYADIQRTVRKIIGVSLVLELLATGLLFWSWHPAIAFRSASDKFFYSAFHAVSAFNNAGFSLFRNGLFEQYVAQNYAVHFILAVLIILGGLGFTVLSEIFTKKTLRLGQGSFFERISLHSKLVLYSTTLLLLGGTVLFYLLERQGVLLQLPTGEGWFVAFFQSVTTRTAGFNTVDVSQLQIPTLWIFIFLMFVGASPGSTGGGVKTTTFALLIKSGIAVVRQKKHLHFFRKAVPYSQIDYAYALLFLSSVFIFAATFLLTITDSEIRFEALLFEAVSAFATVGLSVGITAQLSVLGKIILIVTMFAGRIGPLTLTLSFVSQPNREKINFSKSEILVG